MYQQISLYSPLLFTTENKWPDVSDRPTTFQGLILASGNPKQLQGIADLKRPGVSFVNRQKGSGTRVLLDIQLSRLGILPAEIAGYERELNTHLAVASSIRGNEADAALGIEAAARSYDLGFLPLFRERYDLIIPKPYYSSKLLSPLIRTITGSEFKEVVNQVGGYDTSQTGMTTFH